MAEHTPVRATGVSRGATIRDNDPRMPNRRLVIDSFEAHPKDSRIVRALCRTIDRHPREYRIDTRRIFSDDKPRRTGFSVERV